MPKTIEFIFDFASPNAYLAHRSLPDMLKGTDYRINMLPCLLGGIFKATGNSSPLVAHGSVKGKLEYTRLETMRFIKKHALTEFRLNPHFPVNTLLMMRGAVVAKLDGKLESYVDAGFAHMWEKGLNMSDPKTFASAMTDAGFDGNQLVEHAQNDSIKAALIDNTSTAVQRGAFGMPTFFLGDQMFFGKDSIQDLRDELIS